MKCRPALLAAVVSSAGLLLSTAAAAAPAPVRAKCSTTFDLPGAKCRTLVVPIDRRGTVPGRIKLFFQRVPAKKKSTSTIIVFPGGPGAATSILGYDVLPVVRKSLPDHDLLLLDLRGTGRSQYLDCDQDLAVGATTLLLGDNSRLIGKGVQRCAKKIGARRSYYTTRESIADVEAVRQALGIDKFVLIGVSYGTRDAMAYARAYPEHTDRIVLDSLVTDNGLDTFGLNTIQAVPRLLRQLCRNGGCDGITTDPVADLEKLVAQLRIGPLRSHRPVVLAGCSTRVAITRSRLFGLFQEADEDPALLSQLPVAINQAANGRPYQLSLLLAVKSPKLALCAFSQLFNGLFPDTSLEDDVELAAHAFSTANQVATLCEESSLPWPRESVPADRSRFAERALSPLSDAAFAPFDRATVLSASLVSTCKFWPSADSPPELPTGPLPEVPTLILGGLDDLRTPAEDAEAFASVTPGAQLLLVPDVGHSTLTVSGCARRAFFSFMANTAISPCHRYEQHRPRPARHVKSWQHEIERLLHRVPRPGTSAR